MDTQSCPLNGAEVQFHLAEYARLTNEINQRISESSIYEATTAGGLAAYLGWYLTAQSEYSLEPIAQWALVGAPILFFLAALIRSGYSYWKIGDTADYIKLIEGRLAHDQILGWEHVRSESKLSPERRGGVYAKVPSKNIPFLLAQCAIWGCVGLIAFAPLAAKLTAVAG